MADECFDNAGLATALTSDENYLRKLDFVFLTERICLQAISLFSGLERDERWSLGGLMWRDEKN
ncbi:hypothetical protein ISN45_Aa07g012010 [Arabidopsis thaliana x Arabidopsis arenosa]|uniref:Uncharacterized protein n=1 Tax=Arabidopsis thaliana x Arabidopsis arenosa TaxID=1240361 RepID=A0A8T1Y219_9BRAS|nr:hypothetical protein ISN45_Aa07g012010 [Arabidopsis thaliana x Arabidopsis arenosa]